MSTTSSRCGSDSLAEPRVYLRHSFTATLNTIEEEEEEEEEDNDDRQDSAYSSDDPDSPKSRAQTRPLQPLDPAEGKFDLSDDEDEDDESSPPLAEESTRPKGQSRPPSVFSALVAHYEQQLRAHAPFAHMARAERALITQLRAAPVALADVHALLHDARPITPSDLARTPPSSLMDRRKIKAWFDNANVTCNGNVMSALAGNIAYFAAWDAITSAELEDMLVHIVSMDPRLFDLVKRNLEVEAWVRRYGVVPRVDMVADVQQADFAAQPAKKKKKKQRKEKQFCTLRAEWEEEMCGWFAATRLHNGPGLMDRRVPVVQLPVLTGGGFVKRKWKRKGKAGRFGAGDPRAGLEMRTQIPLEFGGGSKVKVRLPQVRHLSVGDER